MAERQRPHSLQSRYVDSQRGWQYLFFSIAIACIGGLAFRLYFSPERLKGWVEEGLRRQKGQAAYVFDGAKIRLARGAIPEFSIVLTGVRVAPAPKCNPEPSLTIAELTLPFRLSSLFTGHLAVGTISAEDMVVDLDGFKKRCVELAPPTPTPAPAARTAEKSKAPVPPPAAPTDEPIPEVRPWWTEEQVKAARSFVEGIDFKKVEVQFEEKSKRIYLDSFAAEVDDAGLLHVSTELRVPPEIVYDEKIPPLVLEITASSVRADVVLLAGLDEGRLETEAVFTPGPDRTLDIDMKMSVDDVPLSTVIPLMKKAGITDQAFEPRFLWLDCKAHIKGPFQGLFLKSPFVIENCSIVGDGTRVEISKATRKPDGTWEPMGMTLRQVDLNKLFRTLALSGPEGVASDFGRLTGEISLRGPDDATFIGSLDGAKLQFSRRSVRVEQRISHIGGRFDLKDGRFKGEFNEAVVENGEFAGKLEFDLDRRLKNGTVKAELSSLSFDPRVQELLVDGLMGPVSGSGQAKIDDGKLVEFDSKLSIAKTEGREWRFEKAEIATQLKDKTGITMTVSTPALEVNKASTMFTALSPVFFGHEFQNEWIALENLSFEARVPEGGGVRWSKARTKLESGKIELTSEGAMSRERALFGWVELDYPKAKKLRWALGGKSDLPTLEESSASLKDFKKRITIDDEALGL